ncbi:MAG: hypothetical protein J6Z47_06890 [Bacteroidales bacterium]|nr:hypothetical protein [Bacteroidales bacterium]
MKANKTRITALVIAFLLPVWLPAQTVREEIEANRDKAGYVYSMYDFDTPAIAKAPKGYKPFYISHYGRHGARFSGSNSEFVKVRSILLAASREDNLTDLGKDVLRRYETVFPLVDNHAGDLTRKGYAQQKKLAARMMRNFPEVFRKKGKVHVDARSTTRARCIMSMAAFCEGLKEKYPGIGITRTTGASEMAVLNPFTEYNPEMEPLKPLTDTLTKIIDEYSERVVDPHAPLTRLFKDVSGIARFGSEREIESMFYRTASFIQNTDSEARFWDIFTLDEMVAHSKVSNCNYFLLYGPDTLYQGGRRWSSIHLTMEDIISKAVQDIASGETDVRLRFGHDIMIIPMLAFLGVEGWDKPMASLEEIAEGWHCNRVPVASNIQFVFYRNKKDDILVRVLYNERDIELPIGSTMAPFYNWTDFKAFCDRQIALTRELVSNTNN